MKKQESPGFSRGEQVNNMHDRYLYAEALQTQTRIADMRTRLATMATYRALAHGLTDDEAALLAEAATMIGRVAERMYRDLVLRGEATA